MTCQQILTELQNMGNETTRNTLLKHGATEPLYGVKVEDLKKIQKKVKKNYELSLELFDTGVSDARYLAGLIADEKKMTKKDLEHWADTAGWHMISEYTVPWIASESSHGLALALEWIAANEDGKKACGWSTLASIVTIQPDSELPLSLLQELLQRIAKTLPSESNRTRYAMNSFVIALGCSVQPLYKEAMAVGQQLGKITVDMNGTACKVPYAPDYIQKAVDKGSWGKKKKMARC